MKRRIRSRNNPPLPPFPKSPTAAAIRRERLRAGLSHALAGAVVYVPYRTWCNWEYGIAHMAPAMWELWLQKTAHLRDPALLP
jgi:hypothetical protein